MKIPLSNRMVDVELPNTQGQAMVTVKNIMEDFHRQTGENFPKLFEAFVLLSARKIRMTCRTALNMEEVCHLGLTFRDVRLTFNPVRTAKWVNITPLSYAIPNEAIDDALKPYGKVIQIKMDSFHGVYVGVRQVLMELSKPIPSRLTIAAHSCNCFYVGQVQTCFSCHQTGHMTKDFPNHAHTTGIIINADGPLTGVNRPSTSTVPEERIGAHVTGNSQLNNSVTHSDVPNAAIIGYRKDSDNSEDEDEFVDVVEELPLPEGEGGEQPIPIVLGKRTREPDDSDVSDISEKRVDRNPSSDGSVVEDDFVPSSLPLPPSLWLVFSPPICFRLLVTKLIPYPWSMMQMVLQFHLKELHLCRGRFVPANRKGLLKRMILHFFPPHLLRMILCLLLPKSL
ncbi:Hypothetical predicted protein, partial [Paramuricea clavata]